MLICMKSPIEQIQAPAASARRGPRRPFTLAIDEVHPWIRIAHIQTSALRISSRIIFDHEFVLILRGEGELIVGEERFEIRPHRLFFIGPYLPHEFRSKRGSMGEHLAVHFDLAPGFPPFASNVGRRRPYEVRLSHGLSLPTCTDLASGHTIEQCLIELVQARNAGGPTAPLEASTLLQRAILLLLKAKQRPKPDAAHDERNRVRMERVVAHIRENFAQDLPVSELSEVAGLSPAHLARMFTQWTGSTPAEYVRMAKIERARALMGQVDLSIKEVARVTGFKNQYHFSRVFRQVDGLTPTLYREAKLAGRRS